MKFGFKHVRNRKTSEHPDQLNVLPQHTAETLDLTLELSGFEQALLWDERGDSRAAELCQKAIAEGNWVAEAHRNLGIIESQRASIAKAFDCFTTSSKHNPRHVEAHYNLGNLYFDANDFRLAQLHYGMVAEIHPAFPNVYFDLVLVQAINSTWWPPLAHLPGTGNWSAKKRGVTRKSY